MNAQATDLQITHFGPRLEGPPVVSVLMITYNHEAYIREAIESVFAQVTTFPIELVIGEDCSTDGTRRVIEHVCVNATIFVKLITSGNNVGMHANLQRCMKACVGEFVAMLEGDDYWIDALKLENQTSFLKENENTTMIFHQAILFYDAEKLLRTGLTPSGSVVPVGVSEKIVFSDIVEGKFHVPTASTIFRREVIQNIPDWIAELPFCDIVLLLMAANRGEVHFIEKPMSIYRITNEGASAKFDYVIEKINTIKMLRKFRNFANLENRKMVEIGIYEAFFLCASNLEAAGRYAELENFLKEQMLHEMFSEKFRITTLKWCVRICFPRTYRVARWLIN